MPKRNRGLILAWFEVFVKGSCIDQDDGAMKCNIIDFNYSIFVNIC